MPLRVQCSAGHLMMVPDHRAGTVLRCPNCGVEVQVPGEPVGPAKTLGQPKLKPPIVSRSGGIPAISGAGEQSPQVAGRSPAGQSRLPTQPKLKQPAAPKPPPEPPKPTKQAVPPPLQTPALARKSGIGTGGKLAPKDKLKAPVLPKVRPVRLDGGHFESPPVQAEGQPAPEDVAPPMDAEIVWTEAPPTVTDEVKIVAASAKTPPMGEDIVFANLQTKPKPAEKPQALEKPKAPEPTKARWQTEASHPAPPKPVTNRPRSTMTGTILAPETFAEDQAPPPVAPANRKERPTDKPRWVDGPPEPAVAPEAPLAGRGTVVEPSVAKPTVAPRIPQEEPLVEAPPIIAAPVEEPMSLHGAATVVDPHRPPVTHAPPVIVTQGVQPTASQRITVWQLAAALLAAALLSIGPSIWEIGDYLVSESGPGVARWAFFLLVLGAVQIGCLAILIQVPDWSSVWIVTIQSLVLAAIYAAVLGLTVITGGSSTLITALMLDDQYQSGKAPLWCVCLAATYACLAFFAGRFSAKWRKVMKRVQLSEEAAYMP